MLYSIQKTINKMDEWLRFKGNLSIQVPAVACLREFKLY